MSGDDIALDFMSEEEVAEILATEDLLQVDMSDLADELLVAFLIAEVASDSDNE